MRLADESAAPAGVVVAETCPAAQAFGDYRTFVVAQVRGKHGRLPDLNPAHAAGPLVPARVDAGRWLWTCECGAHNYVALTLGNVCPDCNNAATAGRPRRVVMPARGQREQIEAILLRRREPATRNWQQRETLLDLLRENLANGE